MKRLIRRGEVEVRTGLARSTIYAKVADGTFPKPVPIGLRGKRWCGDEVNEWIEQRIAERDQAASE